MAYEYTFKGKVFSLTRNPKLVAVRFREPSDSAARRAVIESTAAVGSFDERFEIPREKLTIVPVAQIQGAPESAAAAAAVSTLNAQSEIEHVAPVFDLGTRQVVAPNRLLVGFKSGSKEQAVAILASEGGSVVGQLGDGNEYKVELPPSADPFDVVSRLEKHAEVEYAEPDFVTIGSHLARAKSDSPVSSGNSDSETNAAEGELAVTPSAPNDPFQRFKYASQITQAALAWQTVIGLPSIRIAILDDGVDLAHPDLSNSIAGSFDALTGQTNQPPNAWDSHGTGCAGLAAAVPHNGLGIRGMGNGCALLAVRIASSPAPGEQWACTESNVVEGIDWAWRNGADVLSNSWGVGLPSTAISKAIDRARQSGRQGKGCVVVAAAGNHDADGKLPRDVEFPASEMNVLAVSASNQKDEPKTQSSSDGENWWGSNFGPEVDLAAPGVHHFTTDIAGVAGNSAGGILTGDYVNNFNGTSSATPIVAGIIGLVLSANPALTETQVRRLLTQTADKVGGVVYANGRNDQMGQGRVNALRAVQAAPTFV